MIDQPRRILLGDLLNDWVAWAALVKKSKLAGRPIAPQTGIPLMDSEICGGFLPGLHVITGDAGAGKTAFALHVAVNCGYPCLYVTCEMHPLELMRRMAASVSGIFLNRFKTGELSEKQMLDAGKAAARSAPNMAIYDARNCYARPEWIVEQAWITKDKDSQVLIIVDSLHSWSQMDGTGQIEYEQINNGVMQLKAVAADLDCPTLYIAERNRANKQGGGTGSGAGSRKIEYGAETQIDLNRDMTSKPDPGGWLRVEAKFVKNRNGGPGRVVNLGFNGATQRFKQEDIQDEHS